VPMNDLGKADAQPIAADEYERLRTQAIAA
jgi:hypothetical protein